MTEVSCKFPVSMTGFLIPACLFALALVPSREAANCRNQLDIVIAVDTTSSHTASSFEQVKAEVKKIAADFTIGKRDTRLALVSVGTQARVEVNFDGVNSDADFNTAVDSLAFSQDTGDLSEGIKVARESVLNGARAKKTNKILILVKDRQSGTAAVSDNSILSRIKAEAETAKNSATAIHSVGIGGLWHRLELEALYGRDYLMFKDKNKALGASRSLNNQICESDCPQNGQKSEKTGLCYDSTRHITRKSVLLTENSAGESVCRTQIEHLFVSCSGNDKCNERMRDLSSCVNSQVTIVESWKFFSQTKQTCEEVKKETTVPCGDQLKCDNQVADVMFILDKSGSTYHNYEKIKSATLELVKALNIRPDKVLVGLIEYNNDPTLRLHLGEKQNKDDVIAHIVKLTNDSNGLTYTDKALKMANEDLDTRGGVGVAKYVFLITDGESTEPKGTLQQVTNLKNKGVTLYVIGINFELNKLETDSDMKNRLAELKAMTGSESDTNLFIMDGFETVTPWAEKFSRRLCLELSPPHPRFCEDKVSYQSVSECISGKQKVTITKYAFDNKRNCIKSYQATDINDCLEKCTDPVNGNEYVNGNEWKSLCIEFKCDPNAKPLTGRATQCRAADGNCIAVDSPPFTCRDEDGNEHQNCQCIRSNGNAVLVIDKQ